MPTFKDFYFNSSTGKNKIHARMCVPDAEPRAIVQIIHGIAEYIDRYDEFMSFLADNGIIAVGTDHLGHGKSIESEEQTGFLRMITAGIMPCVTRKCSDLLCMKITQSCLSSFSVTAWEASWPAHC